LGQIPEQFGLLFPVMLPLIRDRKPDPGASVRNLAQPAIAGLDRVPRA
jgi:hypothetical protein